MNLENKYIHRAVYAGVNVCRFLLAIVFLFSGFIKANDPMGTVYKVQDYFEAWGMAGWNSGFVPYLIAWIMAIVEFTLGSYLLFGIRRRLASVSCLLFMLVMTPLTLWLAVANPISDCGCFGDAVHLSNWDTFWKNVVLLLASIVVFFRNRSIFKLVTDKMDWLVAMYSTVFVFLFTYFTLSHLPVFDFRPYRIGADIKAGMEIPEGVKLPVYETIFTYQKDGVQKEFTIDNFPTDSTWKFVESKTVLKEKGYEPPIKDFVVVSNDDGFDITDEILNSDYAFLLVSPWLENADDSSMDLINEIYDYSLDHGYKFYCVTASSDEAIARWQDYTGAEYPFATMDEITLKTIIRSNPGLVLLKDGVVIRKWSNFSFPDEYQLSGPLDKLPIGQLDGNTFWEKVTEMLVWFFGPLILFIFIDLLWLSIRRRKKVIPVSKHNNNEKKN